MDIALPYKELENNLQSVQENQSTMQSGSCINPPTGYSQLLGSHLTALVAAPRSSVFPVQVGPNSMEITCPSCQCRIQTKVRHKSTSKTHIACILLCWTGCCCCLPYCMDSCRNANHFCPMCGCFIGTYAS